MMNKKIFFAPVLFILSISFFIGGCAGSGKRSLSDPSVCMTYLFENNLEKIKEYSEDCLSYRDPETKNTLLMMAASKGFVEITEFLIEKDVNINSVNHVKQTALHFAVVHNKPEIIKILITNGAELRPNNHGLTPLMMAIQLGTFEMVQLLDPTFEDINLPADDGWTSAYFAVRKQDQALLDYLLEKGVCTNNVDQYSQTPVDFAKETKWKYAVDRLSKKGKNCALK